MTQLICNETRPKFSPFDMNWRQTTDERVRHYAQYIEDSFYKNIGPIGSRGDLIYPKSKSEWLIQGVRPEVFQELPDYVWNSDISWPNVVAAAEDAEWLLDLYGQKSRIGRYDSQRFINRNGFTVDRDGYVIVYTDGSCLGNGKNGAKGGIGVWFGRNDDRNVSEPMERSDIRPTNQDAELEAAIAALEILKKWGEKRICIYTDSDFMIKSMDEWIFKWIRNGWQTASGRTVKHKPKFRELLRLMEKFKKIEWVPVGAHQGEEGNTMADRLAKDGAFYY